MTAPRKTLLLLAILLLRGAWLSETTAGTSPRRERPHEPPLAHNLGLRPGDLTRPDAWEPPAEAAQTDRQASAQGPVAPTIYVHASTADIHGKGLRYEKKTDRDNIGFWSDPKGSVSWDVEVKTPDTFDVMVTVACPANNAGGTYAVEAAGQKLPATVPDTGGWGKFATETIGTMAFPTPGTYTVSVTTGKIPHGALMNLQAVTFRSTRWDDTLVAWWRFEDRPAGADAWRRAGAPDPSDVKGQDDEVASPSTVTLDGAGSVRDAAQFVRWVRGARDAGLKFNGCSSVVRRAANRVPELRDAMTVEAWVRLDSRQEVWCPIVNHLRYPNGFYFGLDGAGRLGLHMAVGGRWEICSAQELLPVGEWTHVAATFERGQGLCVYINGSEAAREETRGARTPAKATDLLIGRHSHHPWVWHGVIDEVKLYNRALGPVEVGDHADWGRDAIEQPPAITLHRVTPDRTRVDVYERVTLDLELAATFDNPFDPEDVRVDAEVTSPSGRRWTVPGFYYQPYRRRLEKDREVLERDGEPRWQVRLSFAKPGRHWVQVVASDRTGTMVGPPVTVDVRAADAPGFIRVHPEHHHYFGTDRGETFFPIGANICWAGKRQTYDYDEWLAAWAEHGGNYFRVWLSPQWPTLALNTCASGFDAIDLRRAWRLDHVLGTAERLGLYMMFCIDSFNIIRTVKRSPGNWEDAPYIRSNGGPLDEPHEYFTDRWNFRAYKNRLRYLVARWGYSPHVFAWEFWNEVDCMDDYDPHADAVRRWHAAMGGFLRTLDPWDHLVSTSYARTEGDPGVNLLPEMDFVMSHSYEVQDMALELGQTIQQKTAAQLMPHLHGEFGILHSGQETRRTDPDGIHLHNALFASVGQGQAGTPMTWWWDLYVHPEDLYGIYESFATWIEGFDFAAQQARPMNAWFVSGSQAPVRPDGLPLVRGTWSPAPFNQPVTVTVDRTGAATMKQPVSNILQGQGFHKKLHNPVTFELEAPEDIIFGVQVAKTSGHAGARLRVSLDGAEVFEKPMPLPKGFKGEVFTEYAGAYAIQVPEGRHTVTVANTGEDWIEVAAYHIPWLRGVQRATTPLRIFGLTGNTRALVWVQNERYVWPEATKKGFSVEPVAGAQLRIADLAPGEWRVEHYDTQAGEVTDAEERTVGPDGTLTVSLPPVTWDAALRLRRVDGTSERFVKDGAP
jgi:hypothetical protein